MNVHLEADLKKALSPLNIPAHRKMSTSPENLRWLLKNLGARNSQHPNYNRALELLKSSLAAQNVSV